MSALRRASVRMLLALGMLTVSAASAHATVVPDSYWCYNGTCCAQVGGAVTTDCAFSCSTMLAGDVTVTIAKIGCSDI